MTDKIADPRTRSGIEATINVDEAAGLGTIGVPEPDLTVTRDSVGTKTRIKIESGQFSLGGDYDGLSILLSEEEARTLADGLLTATRDETPGE